MSKIAVLGIGLMGEPLVKRLLETGHQAIAYNRTPSKLATVEAMGAEVTTDVGVALQNCDCALLMLSDAKAIASVLDPETVYPHLQGRVIIQMGTIAPRESQNLLQTIEGIGGEYLEAPVLGSIPQVKTGELLVMVGATSKQYEQWSPLLANLGPDPMYIGAVGTASALKLALNQLIASLTAAFGLSLSFVQRQGVDVEQFMTILRQSALYAPTFDKKLSRMLEHTYANPNFPTKHLLKDVDLFIDSATGVNLNVDALTGVRTLVQQAMKQGLAEGDYSAIFEAISSTNNTDLTGRTMRPDSEETRP